MIKIGGILQTVSKRKDHTPQPINSVPSNATSFAESRPGNNIVIEEDPAETSPPAQMDLGTMDNTGNSSQST